MDVPERLLQDADPIAAANGTLVIDTNFLSAGHSNGRQQKSNPKRDLVA
jgi:hypothetical protein